MLLGGSRPARYVSFTLSRILPAWDPASYQSVYQNGVEKCMYGARTHRTHCSSPTPSRRQMEDQRRRMEEFQKEQEDVKKLQAQRDAEVKLLREEQVKRLQVGVS